MAGMGVSPLTNPALLHIVNHGSSSPAGFPFQHPDPGTIAAAPLTE
jgi:hypothetical protein